MTMRTVSPGGRSVSELLDLRDRVAIVTGGALGIGQAIAFRLAEAGANVVITDVNMEAANQTVDTITEAGGSAVAIRADASSVDDARQIVAEAKQRFGRVDYLVNNAGIYPMTPALELTEAQWDRVLDINLKGAFFYAQAVAREIIAEGHDGAIVNIASIDGIHPTGNLAHYDASKGGVIMVTKSLAKELGPQGVRVNAIAPGGITTPGASAGSTTAPTEEVMKAFMQRIPLRRMGNPDDIATTVLFLLSPASAYIAGGLVVVDGGYLVG